MKISRLAAGCLFGFWLAPVPPVSALDDLREPQVLYFDQDWPEPVVVRLSAAADVFFGHDFQSLLATLPAGQEVRVIGQHTDGWLIHTTFKGNEVEGWIYPRGITTVDPALLNKIRANRAHREAVEAAIKENRVVQGMTTDEVRQSLGKPDHTDVHEDANAKVEVWSYVAFERVPQIQNSTDAYGRLVQITTYVKVPVGRLSIEFHNNQVTAVDEQRDHPDGRGLKTP